MTDLLPRQREALDRLRAVVSSSGFIDDEAGMKSYVTDIRGRFSGRCSLVLQPASTAEVSKIVEICSQADIFITPQGGNTGLCGAAVPPTDGVNVLLSLKRMDRIRHIDPSNFTITVEAGCILKNVQMAAHESDRHFPLSLGAEGTCLIGGNLSTNAGGVAVLKYGNARDLVLGLEVVLADGQIWNGLRGLRKDNTGYDLKHLFLGAEGTLGIITAATLKLFPAITSRTSALAAFDDINDLMPIFDSLKRALGDELIAFEYFPRFAIDLAVTHVPGVSEPFDKRYNEYLLLEVGSGGDYADLNARFEHALAQAIEHHGMANALIAQSQAQASSFWRIREGFVEAQHYEGARLMHDVSVPLSAMVEFIGRASERSRSIMTDVRPFAFGHVGDGNIHFHLLQPRGAAAQDFILNRDAFEHVIYRTAQEMRGSFSAEHGIGSLKVSAMAAFKDPVELRLMATVKKALDPKGIFNPGKILPNIG